jgi:hypothetical protein
MAPVLVIWHAAALQEAMPVFTMGAKLFYRHHAHRGGRKVGVVTWNINSIWMYGTFVLLYRTLLCLVTMNITPIELYLNPRLTVEIVQE